MKRPNLRHLLAGLVVALVASGCSFSATDVPLPGGADVGDNPYEVTIEFRDVLDLVPQSAVRVDDIAVGRVKSVELEGWTAVVVVELNGDVKLPANAEATIRQSSLLGEKFVSLAAPVTGGTGTLANGDEITLEQSGRNPEVEEVLGAASLLFNNGGLDKVNTIVTELNKATTGNEADIKALLDNTTVFLDQIDQNKDALLSSLEKVNNLAITANGQRDAIESALDNLPEAFTVLDQQRDDLVTLTTALKNLGDTATGVVQASREDTVANLQALQPLLSNLAVAGQDIVENFSTFVTFPFPNSAVGGTLAAAQQYCPRPADNVPLAETPAGCGGDYLNLNVNVNLDAESLVNLFRALIPTSGTPVTGETQASTTPVDGQEQLTDLVQMLSGGGAAPAPAATPGATPTPGTGTPTPGTTGGGSAPTCLLPGLLCRTTVAPTTAGDSDLAMLLLDGKAS
ncbi:MCE family protein [Aeromicrobium sp. Leaf350]|uniref:MCE family protein n=1 Tax=Aeromicrobium sp. Leaf350 TaxID=2876565 RepID=UPI001E33A4E2|nr:MCE family protein [Aeromicrobium sp. Leaf350]